MRIRISGAPSGGFSLRLPTGLLLNGLTAPLLARKLRKQGIELSAKSLRMLFRAVKAYKKAHPQWSIVKVESTRGERVDIRL